MGNHDTIVISGPQGSGKSTLALNLAQELYKLKKYRPILLNFADPLYEIHNFARGTLAAGGIDFDHKKNDGPLLQFLGTEWGRKIDRNIWIKILKKRVFTHLNNVVSGNSLKLVFIIADCRFKNEFNAFPNSLRVRLNCSKSIRKERVSMWRKNDKHPSEIDLDSYAGIETKWWRKPLVYWGILSPPKSKFDITLDTGKHNASHCTDLVLREFLLEEAEQRGY